MNLDVILVKREKFHLVSHKVLQHLVYFWQVWICLIDSLWFERAGINCLSCHLYSLTFLCLVCWFTSLSWEIEFGQLCWKSAWVFLRVLLRQVETPCLGVRNTRSGVRGRKVSRRLFDQASDVHLYSSCRSLLISSLYEEIFTEVMKIISHIQLNN